MKTWCRRIVYSFTVKVLSTLLLIQVVSNSSENVFLVPIAAEPNEAEDDREKDQRPIQKAAGVNQDFFGLLVTSSTVNQANRNQQWYGIPNASDIG